MLPRLLSVLVPRAQTPGRQRSYHGVIYVVGAVLLVAVLLGPPRVAGVIVVAGVLVWWLADSLNREGM